jgi:Protein of unknown function (DUF3251)
MKESTIVEMKTYTAAFSFLLLANGYAVCQTPAPQKASVTVRPQQPAVSTRDAGIEKLQREVKELKETVDVLLSAVSRHENEIRTLGHAAASFDPARPDKYRRIETDAGFLLVLLGKVVPYLDGYKVELQIGNPHQMDFDGFKVSAFWGPRLTSSPDNSAEVVKKERNQEFSFTKQLARGRWNSVSLILPSTKPEDFGYLSVIVEVNAVSLGAAVSK